MAKSRIRFDWNDVFVRGLFPVFHTTALASRRKRMTLGKS